MADNTSLRHQSLKLYHFVCQHIVGTEETVKLKRMMNTVKDNISLQENVNFITSGSVGEGLELQDSDFDLMFVLKRCIVHENTENVEYDPTKLNLVMEMDQTKPGFTLLRCDNPDEIYSALCMRQSSNSESLYLANDLIKTHWMNKMNNTMLNRFHGPCLSDKNGDVDIAICVHNPKWIQPAENWIKRGNISWPHSDVTSDVIGHGVLFVPIGCKGSDNEALEWRISFSVAEKLLIYSFCHTQLLCYALMKILLKDCINRNSKCKDLLCSYFIKKIIFWVSEEITVNEWKPENLIPCFMRSFKRLQYYVEYSMCPHFFIPTINMFENKIEGQSQQLLLGQLKSLFSFGWRCVLFAKQFQNINIISNVLPSYTEIQKAQLRYLLTSKSIGSGRLIPGVANLKCYRRCIKQLNVNKSPVIKSIYLRYLSFCCTQDLMQSNRSCSSYTNKNSYYEHRKKQSYLLQCVSHDAVSRWLMLAAFFYNMKHFSKALYLLKHTMIKCTTNNAYYWRGLSELKINLNTPSALNTVRILRALKHSVILPVIFLPNSTMILAEIALYVSQRNILIVPPVIFTSFLSFLCHHHLKHKKLCLNSIADLFLTIYKNLSIASVTDVRLSYNLLGMALQLLGQNGLAVEAFSLFTI